jgi:hypothetical protein
MARPALTLLLAGALGALLPASARAADPRPDSCVECHETLDEPRLLAPVKALRQGDVHAESGFSCVDCHGGDPTLGTEEGTKADAMDPKKGYIGRAQGLDVARMCGRCHSDIELMRRFNPREPTDQQAQWLTSVHGKRAAGGDKNVATCASCHGAHGVKRVKDPASPVHPMKIVETCTRCHADPTYMAAYQIPTDQLAKYERSVHGQKRLVERDPGAPACNSCHGNHGAVPPGFGAVSHACGKCHQTQEELFEASPHAKKFADLKLPTCVFCHGNHEIVRPDDRFLGAGPDGKCATCHEAGGKCDLEARGMRDGIDALVADIGAAEASLADAEAVGMDVARARFELAGARDALVRARVVVHAFSPEKFQETIREGREVAAGVLAAGNAALAEHAYRRRGLAIAAACLVAFAGLLALKARQLDVARRASL